MRGNRVDFGAVIETHVKVQSVRSIHMRFISGYSLATNYDFHNGCRIWVIWNSVTIQLRFWIGELNLFIARFDICSLRGWCWLLLFTVLIELLRDSSFGLHFGNSMLGASPKWAKLDRLLVKHLWFLHMPIFTVVFLPPRVSDHASVLLSVASATMFHRPFRLRNLKTVLKMIHFNEFAGITNRVAAAKSLLSDCQLQLQGSVNPLLLAQEKRLHTAYAGLKKAEMRFLAQKAKVQHLVLSDTNTRYFYASIAARRVRNIIGAIEDIQGQVCHGQENVSLAFLNYYRDLLGSTEPTMDLPADLFHNNILKNPSQLNVMVTVPEIEATLFSIDRSKSPGVDGYSSGFFRDTWSITGPAFIAAVFEFFQKSVMP
ncbi:hypothetical protein RND81_07G073400 [Saponaria officinalis]|uniref:Uncharacterized protein n=1 Tax=Saponaria officinalis TaxID=3572 RepID=A0AAW1JNG0_SAPOF